MRIPIEPPLKHRAAAIKREQLWLGRTGPPGTCRLGLLVRRPGGPPCKMLKEGVEQRRGPSCH